MAKGNGRRVETTEWDQKEDERRNGTKCMGVVMQCHAVLR